MPPSLASDSASLPTPPILSHRMTRFTPPGRRGNVRPSPLTLSLGPHLLAAGDLCDPRPLTLSLFWPQGIQGAYGEVGSQCCQERPSAASSKWMEKWG